MATRSSPTRKQRLRSSLAAGDLDAVVVLADESKRVLGDLLPFTYDPEPAVAWRAVEAMGLAAARVAERDPGAVRELLRRLFWLMSEESGGICWRAPEAMAEVVRRRPDLFGDWVPIIAHLLVEMAEEDLGHFRAGILCAIGALGGLTAGHLDDVLPAVVSALDHPDAQARGMAVRALERVGRADLLVGHEDLLDDPAAVEVYEDGAPRHVTVGALTRRALESR